MEVKSYLSKIALSSFKKSYREIVFDFIKNDNCLEMISEELMKEKRNNELLILLKD
jgi:hypothetical protein